MQVQRVLAIVALIFLLPALASAQVMPVQGGTANNTAIIENPTLSGGETLTPGSNPTVATSGNKRQILLDTEGIQFVRPGSSNPFSCFVEAVSVTTQCQAAPGAGLKAYVTGIVLSNEAATVQSLDIVYGTGSNCVTGITAISHKMQMGTVATTTSPFVIGVPLVTPLVPAAANAICVRPSAATAFGATLTGFIGR